MISENLRYKKIFLAGHNGMVGSAINRKLELAGCSEIITTSRKELDLLNQKDVFNFLKTDKPDLIIIAAAKVGGIMANDTFRAQFIYENLQIQNNLIHGGHLADTNDIIFLGSSCIYPKLSKQPIKEEYLMSGKLEETNEPYAIAKIAGLKMCQAYKAQYNRNYFSLMPTNLYGPGDNYDLNNSHVLPALIRKFHEARVKNDEEVEVWGSGEPRREFLHVDDLAEACLFLIDSGFDEDIVNIGTGKDLSIKELAHLIKKIVQFEGEIVFNTEKPDGTKQKLLDVSLMHSLGWEAKIKLEPGILKTYEEQYKKS